jgi:hypothetical protein
VLIHHEEDKIGRFFMTWVVVFEAAEFWAVVSNVSTDMIISPKYNAAMN